MESMQLDDREYKSEAKLCEHCNKGIKYKQGSRQNGFVWYCYTCGDMEYHSY